MKKREKVAFKIHSTEGVLKLLQRNKSRGMTCRDVKGTFSRTKQAHVYFIYVLIE